MERQLQRTEEQRQRAEAQHTKRVFLFVSIVGLLIVVFVFAFGPTALRLGLLLVLFVLLGIGAGFVFGVHLHDKRGVHWIPSSFAGVAVALIPFVTIVYLVDESERRRSEEIRRAFSDLPPSQSESRAGPVDVWTSVSNGQTWRMASRQAKDGLCSRLAIASPSRNSAAFFFDGLTAFYDSHDPNVLNTKIDDVVRMLEGGSKILPQEMRRY